MRHPPAACRGRRQPGEQGPQPIPQADDLGQRAEWGRRISRGLADLWPICERFQPERRGRQRNWSGQARGKSGRKTCSTCPWRSVLWTRCPYIKCGHVVCGRFVQYSACVGRRSVMTLGPMVSFNIDPVEVGRRLQRLREHHNLSAGAFADSVGIDRSTYSKLEQGKRLIKADSAFAIAERWGVSMDFIYRGRLTELPHSLADALMQARTNGER